MATVRPMAPDLAAARTLGCLSYAGETRRRTPERLRQVSSTPHLAQFVYALGLPECGRMGDGENDGTG